MFGRKQTNDEKAILSRRSALIAQIGHLASELENADLQAEQKKVSIYLAAITELREKHGYTVKSQFDLKLERAIEAR